MKIFKFVTAITFMLAISTATSMAGETYKKIKGIATTGSNHLLGEPLWNLGPHLTGSFEFVFGHNPDGTDAIPLITDTPKDIIVATGVDPNFLLELGLPADFIEPEFLNVPFHQVQIIVNPETAERASVPSELEAPGFAPSRSLPNNPITLAQWLKASGYGYIKCHSDGTSHIRLVMKNLVKNGLYTVWGLWGIDLDNDGLEDVIEPAALGGVPNVLVPGRGGFAYFQRRLGFCPTADTSLKYIDVVYHSDGNAYGGTVDMLLPGFAKFAVSNTHVEFPVNATPLSTE